MAKIWVNITGPRDATEDDLINNGREAIARLGHQVGDATECVFTPQQPLLECYLEVDEELERQYEEERELEAHYGQYSVHALMEGD